MEALLRCLYSEEKAQTIKKLYLDETTTIGQQLLIRGEVARDADSKEFILPEHGTDLILCILAKAHKSEHETLRIFQTMTRFVNGMGWSFEGLVHIEQRGGVQICRTKTFRDLADECLFAVALLREYLDRHCKRTGAPSADYYSKLGKLAFATTGFEDISSNWGFWTNYLEVEFPLALPS